MSSVCSASSGSNDVSACLVRMQAASVRQGFLYDIIYKGMKGMWQKEVQCMELLQQQGFWLNRRVLVFAARPHLSGCLGDV